MHPAGRLLWMFTLCLLAAPRVQAAEGPDAAVTERVRHTLGIFQLAQSDPITDGDTVRVEGLDATLRLLGIDTEETFKDPNDRYEAEIAFDRYASAKRGDAPHPAKYSTPMGEAAKEWAQEWFAGVYQVRLELDDLRRTRGYYGRHLVYILVEKNGQWLNYNVEAVRAGMTPYFTKYGYSARFHDEFVAAQQEARAAKRGIWADDSPPHYPDYEERLVWWEQRAQAVKRFREAHQQEPDMFELGVDEDWERLKDLEGREVTVFGTIGAFRLHDVPFIARMSHRRGQDFSIVAFEKPQLLRLGLERFEGQYVYVRGEVGLYKGDPQFKAMKVTTVWTEP